MPNRTPAQHQLPRPRILAHLSTDTLDEAARELGIDLGQSFMVGDRGSDVAAGRAARCTTVFIDLGYAEPVSDAPDYIVHSIAEAADTIILTQATQRAQ